MGMLELVWGGLDRYPLSILVIFNLTVPVFTHSFVFNTKHYNITLTLTVETVETNCHLLTCCEVMVLLLHV